MAVTLSPTLHALLTVTWPLPPSRTLDLQNGQPRTASSSGLQQKGHYVTAEAVQKKHSHLEP